MLYLDELQKKCGGVFMKKIVFFAIILTMVSFFGFSDPGTQLFIIGYLTEAKSYLDAYNRGQGISPYNDPLASLKQAGSRLASAGAYMDKLTASELREIESIYLELKAAFLRALSTSSGN